LEVVFTANHLTDTDTTVHKYTQTTYNLQNTAKPKFSRLL